MDGCVLTGGVLLLSSLMTKKESFDVIQNIKTKAEPKSFYYLCHYKLRNLTLHKNQLQKTKKQLNEADFSFGHLVVSIFCFAFVHNKSTNQW